MLDLHPDVGIVYGAARIFESDRPGALRRGRHSDEPWMPCVSGTDEVLVALIQGNIMVVQAAWSDVNSSRIRVGSTRC